MTSILKFPFVAACLLAFSVTASAGDGCCGGKEEEKPVAAATPQECFSAAAKGIGTGDVKVVASQLSTKSLELAAKKGEEMKEKLLKDEAGLKAMGLTAEKAKEMSGRDLLLTGMIAHIKAMVAEKMKAEGECKEEGGCCGEEKEAACEIKDVKIDGDKATATCPIGQPLAFVKENGAWKMDISAALEKCGECDGCKGEEKVKE